MGTERRTAAGRATSHRGAATAPPASNGKVSRKVMADMLSALGFSEAQSIYTESMDGFRSRWLYDSTDIKAVIKQCRALAETKPNPFVQWLIGAKMSFYNAGFCLGSETKQARTKTWLDTKAAYPFARVARDTWREYLTCSNVVAFWRQNKAGDETRIDSLPRITILDCDRVTYRNEFGIEKLSYMPINRALSVAEADGIPTRYAEAIRQGREIVLDPTKGDRWKVLSGAKSGYGLGMPGWKAILEDLAILELMKIGDWNGAWARKKLLRHTKKGHAITGSSPLAGQPNFFFRSDFGKKLMKVLNGHTGFADLITNFDQEMAFLFLDSDFFSPEVSAATQMRVDRWGGPLTMMMREGQQMSPYLMQIFRAEGLEQRAIVGEFLEGILNDDTFRNQNGGGTKLPQLKVLWDDTIFFNEKMLMTWLTFAYQNGLISPQTTRRFMHLSDSREIENLRVAHKNEEDYEPVFEPKQGLLGPDNGGDEGGRTAKKDGGTSGN